MNNPIIQRELIGMLRTKRALILQVLLAAALVILVMLRWPSDGRADYTGRQAQQVLELFGYGMLVALILLAPIFPATAVVREKQQGTLALLLNSPMSAWSIFWGKLFGALGFVLILVLLSLPAAAACYAMGGVGMGQIAKLYTILILVAIEYATLGLLISSFVSSTDAALRMTYGAILVLAVITLGPYQFLAGVDWLADPLPMVVAWIRSLSPVPAMMQILRHEGVTSVGMITGESQTFRFLITSVIMTVLMCAWVTRRLNQKMLDKPKSAGKVTDEQTTSVKFYRRLMYLWFFDPNRRSGLIGPLVNPVMVKEFRCRKFGRAYWIVRLFAVCLIIALGLMLLTSWSSMDWGPEVLGTMMVVLQYSLVILLTPSLASGLISAERESGGWALMQMTPLSPLQIVVGKLLSVLGTLTLVLLATLPGYVVILYIDPNQAPVILRVLQSLVVMSVFAVLLSAALSSIFSRTAGATAAAYTLLVGLCAGSMVFWLGRGAPFSHELVQSVLMFNPLAAALSIIGSPGFEHYNIALANLWIMAGGGLLCLVVLLVRTRQLSRPQ